TMRIPASKSLCSEPDGPMLLVQLASYYPLIDRLECQQQQKSAQPSERTGSTFLRPSGMHRMLLVVLLTKCWSSMI
ncbi:hypothetical protein OFM35_34310, partial [Escherichia coli]|nr:hypothetical protein [Escherichia coli]